MKIVEKAQAIRLTLIYTDATLQKSLKHCYEFHLPAFMKEKKEPATFAEFFLHTPKKEKIELFTKAAEKANENQRATFKRAQTVH